MFTCKCGDSTNIVIFQYHNPISKPFFQNFVIIFIKVFYTKVFWTEMRYFMTFWMEFLYQQCSVAFSIRFQFRFDSCVYVKPVSMLGWCWQKHIEWKSFHKLGIFVETEIFILTHTRTKHSIIEIRKLFSQRMTQHNQNIVKKRHFILNSIHLLIILFEYSLSFHFCCCFF